MAGYGCYVIFINVYYVNFVLIWILTEKYQTLGFYARVTKLVRRLETLSSENEKLKEDIVSLTNKNLDLKEDFSKIKWVNTNLDESLAAKERLIHYMKDEKRIDALNIQCKKKNWKTNKMKW